MQIKLICSVMAKQLRDVPVKWVGDVVGRGFVVNINCQAGGARLSGYWQVKQFGDVLVLGFVVNIYCQFGGGRRSRKCIGSCVQVNGGVYVDEVNPHLGCCGFYVDEVRRAFCRSTVYVRGCGDNRHIVGCGLYFDEVRCADCRSTVYGRSGGDRLCGSERITGTFVLCVGERNVVCRRVGVGGIIGRGRCFCSCVLFGDY